MSLSIVYTINTRIVATRSVVVNWAEYFRVRQVNTWKQPANKEFCVTVFSLGSERTDRRHVLNKKKLVGIDVRLETSSWRFSVWISYQTGVSAKPPRNLIKLRYLLPYMITVFCELHGADWAAKLNLLTGTLRGCMPRKSTSHPFNRTLKVAFIAVVRQLSE